MGSLFTTRLPLFPSRCIEANHYQASHMRGNTWQSTLCHDLCKLRPSRTQQKQSWRHQKPQRFIPRVIQCSRCLRKVTLKPNAEAQWPAGFVTRHTATPAVPWPNKTAITAIQITAPKTDYTKSAKYLWVFGARFLGCLYLQHCRETLKISVTQNITFTESRSRTEAAWGIVQTLKSQATEGDKWTEGTAKKGKQQTHKRIRNLRQIPTDTAKRQQVYYKKL